MGDGGGGTRPPPTFHLGGDHIGNVPPTFLLKKSKISCVHLQTWPGTDRVDVSVQLLVSFIIVLRYKCRP